MNDIRRTILWVVFSMSLFLIWDAWNKHTGQPSIFTPPPVTKPAATAAAPPVRAACPPPCRPATLWQTRPPTGCRHRSRRTANRYHHRCLQGHAGHAWRGLGAGRTAAPSGSAGSYKKHGPARPDGRSPLCGADRPGPTHGGCRFAESPHLMKLVTAERASEGGQQRIADEV